MTPDNDTLDERGTTIAEARALLQTLRDKGFEGDNGKIAVGLGRTEDEIADILDDKGTFDDDLLIKVRALAQQRGVELE
ncbi:MAG: hypothetical protein H7Z37_16715 [Pyrinomonadaceae bacterium]|nr:hypothetical protein [Pyrinomonadaceae bacterium]